MQKKLKFKTLHFMTFLMLFGCAGQMLRPQNLQPDLSGYDVKKLEIYPGHVIKVIFPFALDPKTQSITCGKTNIPYAIAGEKTKIFLAESYFSKRNSFECWLQREDMKRTIAEISIKPYPFPKEKLNVPKRKIILSKEDQQRVEREWLMLKELYSNSEDYLLFSEAFDPPLKTFITSVYGTKRIYNNMKEGQHLGTDFRARTGTSIPATNRGKVLFAGDLFYSGKTVILDHGLNIFTTYGHLSEITVQEGEILGPGDIVGKSGATGRVSGPHLHWGVKVNGHWVDGFSLVKAGI